jgi:methyl-accepting chemotaxis protein
MPDQEQPKRTTDERIDAIAMNLELLGHEVAELGVRTSTAIEALTAAVGRLATRMDQLTGIVERTDAKIEKLADLVTGIVQNHERRIAALETNG